MSELWSLVFVDVVLLGAGGGGWRTSAVLDERHACVRATPESYATGANGGVPGNELLHGDIIFCGYRGAPVACFDKVEGVAVADHSILNWQWRCDSV
jgi:hypothetical protein